MTSIRREEVDFTKLAALSSDASEDQHKEQCTYLETLNEKFEAMVRQSSSASLETLKDKLKNIKQQATQDTTHQTNQKIVAYAQKLLVKLDAKELVLKRIETDAKQKQPALAKSAAAKGTAVSAKYRVQHALDAGYTAEITIKALKKDLKTTQKKIRSLEEEIKKVAALPTKDSSTGQEIDELNLGLRKYDIGVLEKDKESLKTLSQLIKKQITVLSHESGKIDEKIKKCHTQVVEYKLQQRRTQITLEHLADDRQEIREKIAALEKESGKEEEITKLTAELHATLEKEVPLKKEDAVLTRKILEATNELEKLKNSTLTLSQDTANAVAVRMKELAAIKRQAGGLDTVAGRICELFHFAEAIVPSIQTILRGTITIKSDDGTESTTEGSQPLLVQPVVERGIKYADLKTKPKLADAILKKMDLEDFQKKLIMQGFLGAWDLHTNNAMVQPVVNTEYLKCEEKSWEYQTQNGTWTKVKDFSQLVALHLDGTITDATKVRNGADDTKERHIQDDETVTKALKVQWKLVLFDNDRVLGFTRDPSTGNHNDLQVFGGKTCLPIRVFPLGLAQSNEPLKAEVRDWILAECQGDALAEKEKIGSQGHPNLWRNFSETTQQHLREHIKKMSYSDPMLAGGNKEELLLKLPKKLAKEIFDDLKKHKKTDLTEEDFQKLPGLYITSRNGFALADRLQDELTDATTIIDEASIQESDLGDFLESVQDLTEYMRLYTGGGEILTPQCTALASQCAEEFYQSDGFKKLDTEQQQRITEAFNRLLQVAEKSDYLILLERNLFPAVDPGEHRALIERATRAAEYVKTCDANQEKVETMKTALPATWGQTECTTLCTNLDTALDLIQKIPMSALVKSEATKELQERCREMQKKLRDNEGKSHADVVPLFKEAGKLFDNVKDMLAPTSSGVYNAMFPHFDAFIDLLTEVEDFKQRLEQWAMSDACTPGAMEKIKEALQGERSSTSSPETQKEIDEDLKSVEAMHTFLTDTAPIAGADAWRTGSDGKWSDTQVQALTKIVDACMKAVESAHLEPVFETKWKSTLTKYKEKILAAASDSTVNHTQIMKGIQGTIKDIQEQLLAPRLKTRLSRNNAPAPRHFLKPFTTPRRDLRDLRNKILLETHKVGSWGYAFVPCAQILRDALQFGLFPHGDQDEQYKKLSRVVESVKNR